MPLDVRLGRPLLKRVWAGMLITSGLSAQRRKPSIDGAKADYDMEVLCALILAQAFPPAICVGAKTTKLSCKDLIFEWEVKPFTTCTNASPVAL